MAVEFLANPKSKTFVTCDSRVVPHRSTEQAQGCLTSEFGWDPVLSPWYERMMRVEGGAGTGGVEDPSLVYVVPLAELALPPVGEFVYNRISHRTEVASLFYGRPPKRDQTGRRHA